MCVRLRDRNCLRSTLKVIDRFVIKDSEFYLETRTRVIYIDGKCCVTTILRLKSFTNCIYMVEVKNYTNFTISTMYN